ncbi:MAG: MFS transporter [Phycisphaerales bacterium]|nr:MFS transporter [Phycisphaerales bacterium]
MNLTDRPLLRLFTLCILYVAQGIPYGFVSVTLAAYLAEQGMSVGEIGALVAMGTLPWTFKWIWGPMIDRFGIPSMGRRRPWILLAQCGMIVTIAIMAFVPSMTESIVLVGWMVFAHNVFNSLQDVSVDALAVDLLREEERGRVSGFMYGAKYFGMFLGGAVLSRVLEHGGLATVFFWQTTMLTAILLLPLLLRERAGERLLPWTKGAVQLKQSEQLAHSAMLLFRRLAKAFSLRSTIFAGIIGLTMFIASGALGPMMQVLLLQDLGWDRVALTDIDGGYGVFLGIAGAVFGGVLADAVGAKRIIAIGAIGLGLCYITFALMSPDIAPAGWISWHSGAAVTTYILASTFLGTLVTAALFSMYMTVSWPIVAGTQFTAYMAILNLSTTTGQWLAGPIESLGITTAFLLFGCFQIATVSLLPCINIHQTRLVLGEASSDSES